MGSQLKCLRLNCYRRPNAKFLLKPIVKRISWLFKFNLIQNYSLKPFLNASRDIDTITIFIVTEEEVQPWVPPPAAEAADAAGAQLIM